MNYDTAAAVTCLTSVFLEILEHDFPTLKSFEDDVVEIGFATMLVLRQTTRYGKE